MTLKAWKEKMRILFWRVLISMIFLRIISILFWVIILIWIYRFINLSLMPSKIVSTLFLFFIFLYSSFFLTLKSLNYFVFSIGLFTVFANLLFSSTIFEFTNIEITDEIKKTFALCKFLINNISISATIFKIIQIHFKLNKLWAWPSLLTCMYLSMLIEIIIFYRLLKLPVKNGVKLILKNYFISLYEFIVNEKRIFNKIKTKHSKE